MCKAWPMISLLGIAGFFILSTPLVYCQQTTTANQNKEKAPARTASEEKLKQELELTGKRLLTIMEKGDPKELIALCSRSGVEFGIDWPPISLPNIRKQVEKKEGIYCVLFDTKCLRKEDEAFWGKEGPPEPIYSYRELFQKASSRDVKVFVLHEPTLMGQVSVYLRGGPSDKLLENPKDFFFVYEDGKWKLAAVPYG